jgi:hypothetical protein
MPTLTAKNAVQGGATSTVKIQNPHFCQHRAEVGHPVHRRFSFMYRRLYYFAIDYFPIRDNGPEKLVWWLDRKLGFGGNAIFVALSKFSNFVPIEFKGKTIGL